LLTARRVKLLSLALLMSGGAVVLTQQWLQGAVRQATAEARAGSGGAAAPVAARRVLVAATALPAGTVLKADHLRWQAWPSEAAGGYLTDADVRLDQMTGAVVRSGLEAGEPLTRGRVAQPGERGVMAAVLRPGYRAVTVSVTASSAVAGFAVPGDHVDLILSRQAGEGRFVSETVLTDVRVLATDQRAAAEAGKDVVVPQTATLEVTPKGAEVVAVVTELGRLSLALRSLAPADGPLPQDRVVTRTFDMEAVQAGAVRPAAPRPVRAPAPSKAAEPATVQVYRGSQAANAGDAS
jgi:pilus assembly protein CpaB